jgi:hypothetical protein
MDLTNWKALSCWAMQGGTLKRKASDKAVVSKVLIFLAFPLKKISGKFDMA